MATTQDLTTLVCLFHHRDQANAALRDLLEAGIPQSSISVIGDSSVNENASHGAYRTSEFAELGVPERDLRHLSDGVENGGMVIAVSALSDHVSKVEDIFEDHSAEKIDEADLEHTSATAASLAAAAALPVAAAGSGATAVPIVEEELVVGKRTVDQGGVRVYRRVIEVPVQEKISLRQEQVTIERRPVDRAVTDADLAHQGGTVELLETAEEAVISKNARVVEEVLLGKKTTQHTETIHDTVRHTEVDIEQLPPDTIGTKKTF